MSMRTNLGPVPAAASPKTRLQSRLDSPETSALGEALWTEMKRGEEPSLSLMAAVVPKTMLRQLRANDRARLLADVVVVHLARMNRDTALDLVEQWLDAARVRVRPALSDAKQISLFKTTGVRS